MEYEHFAAAAMSPFEYAINDIIDEGMPEREDESKVFGHFGYDNDEVSVAALSNYPVPGTGND
ncbi:hypothetical protein J4E90_010640 [Alternaria incomplexa]|uniref:uncharacterized protein n=1 Tax=Alternaria incomplexa TaxID=1187928 RepID=UPI002220EB27|nr:uncharacterized protein J4E90_010640 [Alternaria incomplexa]KAI4906421.1 hypothetical protein J4E90_010640 [Alternaria incomplexa]